MLSVMWDLLLYREGQSSQSSHGPATSLVAAYRAVYRAVIYILSGDIHLMSTERAQNILYKVQNITCRVLQSILVTA